MNKQNKGRLYVVSLPIGNMDDLTTRVKETLDRVDMIACEDTRVTGIVLKQLGISKKTISYYDQVEKQKSKQIIECIKNGESIALVSDAGTPCISDPGYVLINEARAESIDVIPVIGPCAVTGALSVSGLNANQFYFMGFLANKETEILRQIEDIQDREETIVFYDSPKRIKRNLEQMLNLLGDRKMLLCREMTKPYEEFISGKISYVLENLSKPVKGEITGVLAGFTRSEGLDVEYLHLAEQLLAKGLTKKDVVEVMSKSFGLHKNKLKKEIQKF